MSNKKLELKDLVDIFNRYITDTTRYQITPIELYEPMRYSLDSGGKRLRPSLLLAVLAVEGIDEVTRGLSTALALEYVHTYSLIHDDLPAMDDDDLRRGKPTNHKVYGEAIAILAGDGLLTDAFSIITDDMVLSSQQKVELVNGLAKAAGSTGMVMGQVYDLKAEENPEEVTLEELKRTHSLKTGQLFKFALQAAAIILDLVKEERQLLDQFADYFGVAYQIHNDLMDVIGDEEETGKVSNQDTAQNKATYPSLLGVDGAMEELNECIEHAKSTIDVLNVTTTKDYSILNEFLEYLVIDNA